MRHYRTSCDLCNETIHVIIDNGREISEPHHCPQPATGRAVSIVHVTPVNDLIDHVEVDDECPCGPDVEAVFRDDGSNGWLIIHHSLDGRERQEKP